MWKVGQIYLSDFRAGNNYMDDGLIKVLDDKGESRDCLIFSPNGTFKTSLLSIALSQLSPSKDRFIQTLQSSSKEIKDYVIRQRPALVMTKFVTQADQRSLFGEENGDSVVIGQLFFLRPSSLSHQDDVLERLFFISRDSAVFDQIRQLFLSLRSDKTGWDQLKKAISTIATVEDIQRNWLNLLNDAGLDPFLVDKQVEMCKEEGGITKTLTFKDEKAFMSFFLNATMDTERSQNLHSNVLKGMDKHRNVPQRLAELKAANRLKEILTSFEQVAGKWRKLEVEKKELNTQMSEAAYILNMALPMAKKLLEKMTQDVEVVDGLRQEVNTNQQVAVADKAVINQDNLRRKSEALKQEKRENEEQYQQTSIELIALKGGRLLSTVDEKQQSFNNVNSAFQTASKELAPMKLHLESTQAAYHSRLIFEKMVLENRKSDKTVDLKKAEQNQSKIKTDLNLTRTQLSELKQQETRHITKIEQAENACNILKLVNEESPQEGQARLLAVLQQQNDQIAALLERRKKDKSRQNELQERITSTQKECNSSQRVTDDIEQWLDEEKVAREDVLANVHLTVIAGVVDFNPYSQELASTVSDALYRQEIRCDTARDNILKLQDKLGQLEDINTLSEDPLTGELLEHYINEGIADAKLRSFSEYLDTYFDGDTDAIASLMRSDPARFSGLMAVDQETLTQVTMIDAPDWLIRPVVISIGADFETNNPHSYFVVEPKDLTVYSHRALEQKKAALSHDLEKANAHAELVKKKHADLRNAKELCTQLLKRFLSNEHIAVKCQERQTHLQVIEAKKLELKDCKVELIAKAKAIEESEGKEREFNTLKNASIMALSHISSWLELYVELPDWKKALSQIVTDILIKIHEQKEFEDVSEALSQTLLRLRDEVRACISQLDSLMDNVSVPLPSDQTLFPEVPNSNLQVLQQTYYDADRTLNQASTAQGIGVLEEKRHVKQREVNEVQREWDSFQSQYTPDMSRAQYWQTIAYLERSREKEKLENVLIDLKANESTTIAKVKSNQKEYQESLERLGNHCKKYKVRPSLVPADIFDENLEVLMQQARQQHDYASSEYQRLTKRAKGLEDDIRNVQEWKNKLDLSSARIGEHPAQAHQDNHTVDWPSLTIGLLQDRVNASVIFHDKVKDIQQQLNSADKQFDKERIQLNAGFDQVKRQIENKAIANILFDLVQRLLNTDAATFAYQTADFINNCDSVIRNLKMDIDAIDNHVSGLVSSLLDHASDCYQVLNDASQAVVPKSVLVYGGYPILDVKSRLDFSKHDAVYQEAMRNWFFEVVEKKELPQANTKKGDELGASLLYRLLRCSGKKTRTGFGIGLLKLAGQPGQYVAISEDLSSGGERLTSATMLYSVISYVRSRQRQHIAEGNSVSFLFMDNPLSKASKASFIQAQLHTCQAFGIQPIFVTGVGDIAALEQFSNRIVITKADGLDGRAKHLKINGEVFNRVVISEELLTRDIR